jgi:hypothetical protein
MPHLVATEPRICSGVSHVAAQNCPIKLGTSHDVEFSDRLLEQAGSVWPMGHVST